MSSTTKQVGSKEDLEMTQDAGGETISDKHPNKLVDGFTERQKHLIEKIVVEKMSSTECKTTC